MYCRQSHLLRNKVKQNLFTLLWTQNLKELFYPVSEMKSPWDRLALFLLFFAKVSRNYYRLIKFLFNNIISEVIY